MISAFRFLILFSVGASCVLAKPDLPNVLLLGDSISIGYTPHVKKMLKDEAAVQRPMKADGKKPENCAYVGYGLTRIDDWLGDTKWAVIHFNFGLHDLKYIGNPLPDATIVRLRGEALKKDPKARQLSTVDEYIANLEKLVLRLKKTNATLIFCTTTPVPEGSVGRIPGDDLKFNNAAKKLMKKHGIAIHDLHSSASEKNVVATQQKANVHYSQDGSKLLAQSVVKAIRRAMTKN